MDNKLRRLPIIEALAKKKNIKNYMIFDIRDLYIKYIVHSRLSASMDYICGKLKEIYKHDPSKTSDELIHNIDNFYHEYINKFCYNTGQVNKSRYINTDQFKDNVTICAAIFNSAHNDIKNNIMQLISHHDRMLFSSIEGDLNNIDTKLPYDKVVYVIEDDVCVVVNTSMSLENILIYQINRNGNLSAIYKNGIIESSVDEYNLENSIMDIVVLVGYYRDIVVYYVNNNTTTNMINNIKSIFDPNDLNVYSVYSDTYVSYTSLLLYVKNIINTIRLSIKILTAKNFMPEKNVMIIDNIGNKKKKGHGSTVRLMYSNVDISMKPRINYIHDKSNGNHDGDNGENHHKVTHRRRGHFKYYTKERPLFGRYSGLVWVDDTIINKNKGELKDTEYTVKL